MRLPRAAQGSASLIIEQMKGEPDGMRREVGATIARHVAAGFDDEAPVQHLLRKPRGCDVVRQAKRDEGRREVAGLRRHNAHAALARGGRLELKR